ncbi:diacylglycerol kinase family protein [Cytobacillus sp. FSL W7-1323]|uniref:Diacylglycerol kinase n=1 Tax=Cytobacillus kochii TaxID=859143 RepID=A0A248TLD5_9BACI|nr:MULTISPECIES: diacylglycerol kinase family protein [Cytobacillus]ASV68961.1 diacylglycerol kinase [Cytobacillus kochii]MCM3324637.1 diacylglycerol kinase family protein [Cytobacillus kochii]MCM3347030.1 diacylglycerol kinase family protein [Cytobacillus kochii]MDM5208512.1 diacylglycerol kinase family protein [Cytobacillus kochii]MDQ0183686.1 diacylglycerol kinase [Cytobacillus kochii]
MNSDYRDKNSRKKQSLVSSFYFAFIGVITALKAERNLKIHFVMTVLVIFFGIIFELTKTEWLLISFAIAGMIALELMNTAIERVVDLVTTEQHPLAKQAKDIAAGAVLIYAVLTVIIGLSIFLPKIL